MYKYHQLLLAFIFFAFLAACLAGTVFKWDFYELQENRKLALAPDFKQLQIDDWPKAFEAYFDDHFGFRNTFIHRHGRLLKKLRKSDKVLYGKNDWLFFTNDNMIQDYIGRQQPDQEKLERIEGNLASRIEWLEQRGIDYLFVLTPNKVTIYPEYLPGQYQQLKGRTNREALLEHLNERFNKNLLDLLPLLTVAKSKGLLYYSTDTHWNQQGAYFGYIAIVDKLRESKPGIPENMMLDTLNRPIKRSWAGDLAVSTGTPEKYMRCEMLTNPEAATWTKTELNHPTLLKEEHLPRTEKPPFTIHNPNGKYNVLVFHDSFSGFLKDFLPHNFKNTTFIWRYSSSELLKAAVNICQPDIVIEEVVERFVATEKNGTLQNPIDF